jgi:hypothetical protein
MGLICDKCVNLGLGFYSTNIQPHEYIEGRRNAAIWIIGLNPKGEIGREETRTVEEFENFSPQSHPYFKDFSKVSQKLYTNFNSNNSRVAHTDLIKCFSKSFPPIIHKDGQETIADTESLIRNCSEHLIQQLHQYKPKVIICNGSPVSWEVLKMFPPKTEENWNTITSYQTSLKDTGHKFWVVLSGYIGRIDDRNKRRLGKEIEQILHDEKIEL